MRNGVRCETPTLFVGAQLVISTHISTLVQQAYRLFFQVLVQVYPHKGLVDFQ